MLKFEAMVIYSDIGKTRHVFTSESVEDSDCDLFDIMDWMGYDVISYTIEQIGQEKKQ